MGIWKKMSRDADFVPNAAGCPSFSPSVGFLSIGLPDGSSYLSHSDRVVVSISSNIFTFRVSVNVTRRDRLAFNVCMSPTGCRIRCEMSLLCCQHLVALDCSMKQTWIPSDALHNEHFCMWLYTETCRDSECMVRISLDSSSFLFSGTNQTAFPCFQQAGIVIEIASIANSHKFDLPFLSIFLTSTTAKIQLGRYHNCLDCLNCLVWLILLCQLS